MRAWYAIFHVFTRAFLFAVTDGDRVLLVGALRGLGWWAVVSGYFLACWNEYRANRQRSPGWQICLPINHLINTMGMALGIKKIHFNSSCVVRAFNGEGAPIEQCRYIYGNLHFKPRRYWIRYFCEMQSRLKLRHGMFYGWIVDVWKIKFHIRIGFREWYYYSRGNAGIN